MKKALTILLFASLSFAAKAQNFDYNIGFNYLFDNTEYSKWSHNLFEPSRTLHLADFHAEFGFTMQNGNVKHGIYGGYDISREMGYQSTQSPTEKEFLAYYKADVEFAKGNFSSIFGVFPRTFSEGEYNEAVYSKTNYFTDRNFEGMFLKYRNPSIYAEMGLDWFGKKDMFSRERFQIMSYGDYAPLNWLHLGWDFVMYHFATSEKFTNVCDNVMLHPFVSYTPQFGLQKSSLTAGWIQKYDRDRSTPYKIFNGGALLNLKVKNWDFGFENDFFFGKDMMPNYMGINNGTYYQNDLYFGNKFYHTQIAGYSFYDRIELYYEPAITAGMKVRVSSVFHLGNPTSQFGTLRGFQQTMAVIIDLNEIRNNK